VTISIRKTRDALRIGGYRRKTAKRISIPKNMGFVSCGMELVAAILGRIGKCAAIPSPRRHLSCLIVLKVVFGPELAASFARFGSGEAR
jgi:hypothetical protein